RSAFMFDQVNIKVKGVIENMSWFTGDDGKQYHLFGSGGGKDLADRLEVDLIGQVPMTMPMREGSDQGRPVMAIDPENEASLAFVEMAKWVLAHGPSKRTHPELKING
ncbi:MAG: P-loop NTPase, partial [Acidimicrobiaceae bacterium]